MTIRRVLHKIFLAAATLAIANFALVAVPQTASAQDLFSALFGSSKKKRSGRKVVRFSKKFSKGQVIVSFSDRRLYYIHKRGRAISYPIAVPRPQSRWQGKLNVTMKRVDPPWTPTPSMLRENPRLPRHVPGGHPKNPLGNRALYLGSTTYRIHGTDAPSSIGKAVSKGCVRMFNRDVADLYRRIPVGTRVTITYKRFRKG